MAGMQGHTLGPAVESGPAAARQVHTRVQGSSRWRMGGPNDRPPPQPHVRPQPITACNDLERVGHLAVAGMSLQRQLAGVDTHLHRCF